MKQCNQLQAEYILKCFCLWGLTETDNFVQQIILAVLSGQSPYKPRNYCLSLCFKLTEQSWSRTAPVQFQPVLFKNSTHFRQRPGFQYHGAMTFPGLIIKFSWRYCVDETFLVLLKSTSESLWWEQLSKMFDQKNYQVAYSIETLSSHNLSNEPSF